MTCPTESLTYLQSVMFRTPNVPHITTTLHESPHITCSAHQMSAHHMFRTPNVSHITTTLREVPHTTILFRISNVIVPLIPDVMSWHLSTRNRTPRLISQQHTHPPLNRGLDRAPSTVQYSYICLKCLFIGIHSYPSMLLSCIASNGSGNSFISKRFVVFDGVIASCKVRPMWLKRGAT